MNSSNRNLEKYDSVFQDVSKKLAKKKAVVAVLVTGSYSRSEHQQGSDIDFIVITKRDTLKLKEQYRTIDGVAIDVIEMSEKYAQMEIYKDKKRRRRFISGLLSTSRFVHGDEKVAGRLMKSALVSYLSSVPMYTKKETADLLFFLGQSPFKEQRLKTQGKSVAATMRMNHKMATCLEIAFCLENKVVPHHKEWDEALVKFKDKTFSRLLVSASAETTIAEREKVWAKLMVHTIKRLKTQK